MYATASLCLRSMRLSSSGHLHGSVFVTVHLRAFLQGTFHYLLFDRYGLMSSWVGFLEDSPFHEDIDHIVQCFDKTTKPRFKSASEPQYIKFGSTRDNDPQFNIRFGQLKLDG